MDQVIQFAALGLSTGAVYAVLACSLVGVYAATGLVNFAQGSIALWAVWQVAALQHDGTLVLPVGSVSLSAEALPAWPAVAIGVVSRRRRGACSPTCWSSGRCAGRRPSPRWSPRSASCSSSSALVDPALRHRGHHRDAQPAPHRDGRRSAERCLARATCSWPPSAIR